MRTDRSTPPPHRRLLVPAALAVAALGLAGCGSDGASGDGGAAGSASEAAEVPEVLGAELAGTYAHHDVVAYESADMKTLIVTYGLSELEVVGGELVTTQTFCAAEHRTDQPIETAISDAATQAIVPVPVAVEVTDEDGTLRVRRPETPTGIGIELEDPAVDVLPTDPDDPRIVDDDGDGKPGVTVTVRLSDDVQGELYIARRERFAYDLALQDDGSLAGHVDDASEQLLIGASNDLFLTEAPWVQVDDQSKSPITWTPLEGEWDCDQLLAAREELFPPTPEVSW